MNARVLQASGGTYRVRAGGREFDCTLRGKLKLDEGGSVAVGDRVEVEELDDGSCRITAVQPRDSALVRRAVSRRRDQVMAANIDQLAAVVAAARPAPDLPMLDRLLAVAELGELEAFVVLNKIDLREEAEAPILPDALSTYSDIGYDVLPTCAVRGDGLQVLRERLRGRVSVVAGASGVGKSSLLNGLEPDLDLRVGDVSDRAGRGRHTTTSARLIPLDDDTYIADTPGIQHFVPTGVDPAALGYAFREFRPLLGACRFSDCRHRDEPGCAVTDAVEAGSIRSRRHESYLALLEEAEAADLAARTGGSRSGG